MAAVVSAAPHRHGFFEELVASAVVPPPPAEHALRPTTAGARLLANFLHGAEAGGSGQAKEDERQQQQQQMDNKQVGHFVLCAHPLLYQAIDPQLIAESNMRPYLRSPAVWGSAVILAGGGAMLC